MVIIYTYVVGYYRPPCIREDLLPEVYGSIHACVCFAWMYRPHGDRPLRESGYVRQPMQ